MAHAAVAHDEHDDHGHHTPGFVHRWLMSTNHKDIGTLYLIFAVIAGLIGGALSVAMRYNLMRPGSPLVGEDHQLYNVIATAHGLIMVFFTVMPAMIGGFGNWFVPLMIGRAGHGFFRGSTTSASGCSCRPSCCCSARPWVDGGAGTGLDDLPAALEQDRAIPAPPWIWRSSRCIWPAPRRSWAPSIFITTIFNMRAPGMTLFRMPLFVWSVLVTAFLLLLSLPVLGWRDHHAADRP